MRTQEYPALFKKGSKGEVRQWEISVKEKLDGSCDIISVHGCKGGAMQIATQKITEGKNIGKANGTSVWEQATSEAKSMWLKKKDGKYAEEGEESNSILPMLALKLLDRKDVRYPVYVQPKLDGVRCLAQKISDTQMRYTSRKGKEYLTFGHLDEFLLAKLEVGEILDGEIYSNELTFQEIVSRVKRFKGDRSGLTGEVQFWIYDIAGTSATYKQRLERLQKLLKTADRSLFVQVNTHIAASFAEVKNLHDSYVAEGFEGVMVRIMDSVYRYDYRSPNLLKYKEFIDEEFEIVGGKQGTGKDAGTVIFRCRGKGGEFDVRPKGTHKLRSDYWNNLKTLVGKQLTVRYQELTDDGLPRFPIGITVRDYE